jgi:excinuclease ABC subunit C
MTASPTLDFSQRLRALAPAPGVYLMRDTQGNVIYVGKAMRLRDRLRSYFQSTRHLDAKTRELVRHVADFEVIRTDTPAEALILENELIKRHQPRYNVMLKDSKTYPYLKITNEEWPRIISTRRVVDDGGRYFGPYTSAGSAYRTLNLLNRLFPYRKCDKRITGNEEVCLYYHLHQCTAPCIAAVDRLTYMRAIDGAAMFLNGQADEILRELEAEMAQASDAWNFERAAEVRDRISAINHVLERQKIVSPNQDNADVIAVAKGEGGDAGVQVGFLRGGRFLGSEFFPMQSRIEDSPAEIQRGFVSQFYAEAAVVPRSLLLQHELPGDERDVVTEWLASRRQGPVEITAPKRGRKRDLVAMVAKSAAENLEQSRLKFLSDEQRMTGALTELAEVLDLPRLPRRIECFDISTLHGTNPVASMIVFQDGRPAKKEYRRFAIKTVEGSNDFAMMREVIGRRFRRAGNDDQDGKWAVIPDLAIVDGGKGQLSAALTGLQDASRTEQPIVALAKENEELFVPGNPEPIVLPRDSQALFLVQRVRDEAHRFAVAFHRQRRSKATFQSRLDDVPGVGPKRKQALLRHFGSLKGIQAAATEELLAVPGISRLVAEQIKAAL